MIEIALDDYRQLLLRWNKRLALVSRRTERESIERLIRHSLKAEEMLPERIAVLVDIGSGAGFPGIPLARKRPRLKVRWVERGAKKCVFLREAIAKLNLENTTVYENAFELDMLGEDKPVAITALALGGYEELAKSVADSLRAGDGMLLFVKKDVAEGIAEILGGAEILWKLLGGGDRTGAAWIEKK